MKRISTAIVLVFAAIGVLSILSCVEKKNYPTPPGYNLNSPVTYKMPDDLAEVSGITFHNGKNDSLYAEEDESGRVYYFKLGDKTVSHAKFGKSGDYEDLAILGDKTIMLRSDGTFFIFPFGDIRKAEITNVQKVEGLLAQGEYEGMYADEKEGLLYVLCKHPAKGKKAAQQGIISVFNFTNGQLTAVKNADIEVKQIEAITGQKELPFRPSALAKNEATNEWYVLSSVNKCIVITDAAFKVKSVYALNPSIFMQPEGIAFDSQRNLYISNEGDKISPGTVLKFAYKK